MPVIGVMWWSQAIMALNCAAMALLMSGLAGMFIPGWIVALSQVAVAGHNWLVARKLDTL